MRRVCFLLALTLVVAAPCASPALAAPAAEPATVVLQAAADLGLPFHCDWSYDWESRCFRDDGPRLPIGGTDDAVFRAALSFSLAAVPAGASISSAELRLYHDGTCLAPRLRTIPCPYGYVLDAHRILSPSWIAEREPEMDARVEDTAVMLDGPTPQWLRWDLTALTRAWHTGLAANRGVLLKVQDGDEDYRSSGPYGPSAGHPDPLVRPRLAVVYTVR